MTTPPTPPRPEPVATADLVARLREAETDTYFNASRDTSKLLHDATDAIERLLGTRPEPLSTADLVYALHLFGVTGTGPIKDLHARAAKALEDTAAERDRAHATLRAIRDDRNEYGDALAGAQRLARERLEKP